MRTIKILALLLCFSGAAQEIKTFETYKIENGVQSINPQTITTIYRDRIETYNIFNGIPDMNPSTVTIISNNTFERNNGIMNIFPRDVAIPMSQISPKFETKFLYNLDVKYTPMPALRINYLPTP